MNGERRLTEVFGNAMNGLWLVILTQRNAKIHLVGTIAVIISGVALQVSDSDWRWLIAAIVSVWAFEAINTSLEELTDLVSPGFHPVAGRVKDIAAAAVLIAATGAAIIGCTVFGRHLIGN